MKTVTKVSVVAICLALGFSTLGCAKLNPKTEGQIYSALEAKQEAFKKCYEDALTSDREIEGSMKIALNFDPKSKRPEKVEIKNTAIQNEDLKKCVSKAARKIEITDPPGVFVEGLYTIDFRFE